MIGMRGGGTSTILFIGIQGITNPTCVFIQGPTDVTHTFRIISTGTIYPCGLLLLCIGTLKISHLVTGVSSVLLHHLGLARDACLQTIIW